MHRLGEVPSNLTGKLFILTSRWPGGGEGEGGRGWRRAGGEGPGRLTLIHNLAIISLWYMSSGWKWRCRAKPLDRAIGNWHINPPRPSRVSPSLGDIGKTHQGLWCPGVIYDQQGTVPSNSPFTHGSRVSQRPRTEQIRTRLPIQ